MARPGEGCLLPFGSRQEAGTGVAPSRGVLAWLLQGHSQKRPERVSKAPDLKMGSPQSCPTTQRTSGTPATMTPVAQRSCWVLAVTTGGPAPLAQTWLGLAPALKEALDDRVCAVNCHPQNMAVGKWPAVPAQPGCRYTCLPADQPHGTGR